MCRVKTTLCLTLAAPAEVVLPFPIGAVLKSDINFIFIIDSHFQMAAQYLPKFYNCIQIYKRQTKTQK